jgi:hypothetical protein
MMNLRSGKRKWNEAYLKLQEKKLEAERVMEACKAGAETICSFSDILFDVYMKEDKLYWDSECNTLVKSMARDLNGNYIRVKITCIL